MYKKLIFGFTILLATIFYCTFCFATTGVENALNGVQNVVNNAGNAVGGAVKDISNASKNATAAMENGADTATRSITNNMRNI